MDNNDISIREAIRMYLTNPNGCCEPKCGFDEIRRSIEDNNIEQVSRLLAVIAEEEG